MSRERFIPHHNRPLYMDDYGRTSHDAFHFDSFQSSLPVPLPRNGFVYAFAAPTVSNANNGRSPPVSPRSSEEARRSRRGQQGNDSPERDRKDKSSREGSRRSTKSREGEKSTTSKDLVTAALTYDNAAREEWLLGARFSLEHLHDQLSAAHWMYKKAHDDFDSKITPDVRAFVQKDTLGDMWADMLQTNARKEEDERKAAGKREKAPSFRSVRAQVKHGLTSLKNSTCYDIPPTTTSKDQDRVIRSHIDGVIYTVEEALELAREADEDHEACSKAIEKFIWARNLTKSNAHLWRDLDLPTVAGPATADGGACDNNEHAQEEDTSNDQAENKDAQWQQTKDLSPVAPSGTW